MSEQTYGVRLPTGQPSNVIEPTAAWPLAVGAVLGIVGGAGPWATIDKLQLTRTGLDEGFLPFVLCLVVAALAGAIYLRRGTTWVGVTALVLGALTLVLAFLEYASVDSDLSGRYGKRGNVEPKDVSTSWGLYLLLVAGAIVVVSAVLALRRRTARPAAR